MSIESFPEIENFQKLPHQVIVKGGSWEKSESKGSEMRGLVINNSGHPICDIRVNLVLFDEKKIPVLNTSTSADPEMLPQGGMATFNFKIENSPQTISENHLYANWKFDDR